MEPSGVVNTFLLLSSLSDVFQYPLEQLNQVNLRNEMSLPIFIDDL